MRRNGFSVTADRYIRRARVTSSIREVAESIGVKIIRAKAGDRREIGIHLLGAEQFELEEALELAERDCFHAIYLHTFKTWNPPAYPCKPILTLIQGGAS